MRIFKNAWFERFSRKQRISDKELLEAVERVEKGQIDADLGGGILKQRIAREGQGKSGGFRTIIFYRKANRAVFVYGFAKSDRENIEDDEVAQFKKAAIHVLGLSDKQFDELIIKKQFFEVQSDGKEV